MAAPKGNQFWKARTKHGRDKIFESSSVLWDACCEYFEWVESNPLQEEKIFHTNGMITKDSVSKMRAMTLSGLCLFIGIDHTTWNEWKKDKDFSLIVEKVTNIIYNQKFAGAASDLLNANIIARELGLVDNSQLRHADADGNKLSLTGLLDEINGRSASIPRAEVEAE